MKSRLIGKQATITDRESIAYDGWGFIIAYDGEYYHIAMYGDRNNALIFKRSEFKVKR